MHSPTITRRRTSAPPLPPADPDEDRERFAALYARHRDELARYCRSILRHDQDVEDALQSTMAKAFAALRSETREIALRPWLFRIAHNEAISIVRRRVDTAELGDDDGGDPDLVPRAVETRERLRLLRDDLGDLPERQRSALVLRELSGLGHREIADVLGTSPSAVKQAIYEARCALGDCAAGRSLTCDGVQRALSDGDGRTAARRGLRAHLRSCRSCRAFDAALRQRPRDLGALFPAGPALGAGGAVAGLSGLLSGAGGGAVVGSGSATVGVGATAVGAAGSGGLLGGGLAGAGVAKLAGIAAVAVVAGGGAVAVERGTFASAGSDPGSPSAVVREAPSTAGPGVRFAAASGGAFTVPVVTAPPGRGGTTSDTVAHPARPSGRGTETSRGKRRDAVDRAPADRGASGSGPARRAAPAASNRRPARGTQPGRGAAAGRPVDGGRRPRAGATPARAAEPARTTIQRSPARPTGTASRSGNAAASDGKGTTARPTVSSVGSTGQANRAAASQGDASGGRPAATATPAAEASPATGSSGKLSAPPSAASAGSTGD